MDLTNIIGSKSQKKIYLGKKIASSGEGDIYQGDDGKLAKIYRQLPTGEKSQKLKAMLKHPPTINKLHSDHIPLAYPESLLLQNGQIIGFLMPQIKEAEQLNNIYHPQARKDKKLDYVDWFYLHQIAINIAKIVKDIHASGLIIGDMKSQNILVDYQGFPAIIDVDSFQVSHQNYTYHCPVGSPGFNPPELLRLLKKQKYEEITQNTFHDYFRLAVIIHFLLFSYHPFRGQWMGKGETPAVDDLVSEGWWGYGINSLIKPAKTNLPFDIVHPEVQNCFLNCFNQGHTNPRLRPTPDDWIQALKKASNQLVQCSIRESHWYSQTYGKCCWCEISDRTQVELFPVMVKYRRLRQLLQQHNWQHADLETKLIMLQVGKRLNYGWLDSYSIANFPQEVLQEIDQLWTRYSQGHFGFTTQKSLFLSTGNQLQTFDWNSYNTFGDRIGWRENNQWKDYSQLNFSINAPKGHLPYCSSGLNVYLVCAIANKL